MTEQPNGPSDEDLREDAGSADEASRTENEETDDELVGAEPEGAVSDTTAIKEAGEIGRPASTMRA